VTPPSTGGPPAIDTPPPVTTLPPITPPESEKDDYQKPKSDDETSACRPWIKTDKDSYTVGDTVIITLQVCERSDVSLIDHTPDGKTQVMPLGVLDPGRHSMTGRISEPAGTERVDLRIATTGGSTLAASTSFRVTDDTADDSPGDVDEIVIPNEIRGCVERLGYDMGREARMEGWAYEVPANCTDCCLPCFESHMEVWVNSQIATPLQSMCARQVWGYYLQAPYEVKQEIARIYAVMFWEGY